MNNGKYKEAHEKHANPAKKKYRRETYSSEITDTV